MMTDSRPGAETKTCSLTLAPAEVEFAPAVIRVRNCSSIFVFLSRYSTKIILVSPSAENVPPSVF